MDFALREEQQEVRALAQRILGDHTANEQLRAIEQQEDRYDPGLWQTLAEAGLLGVAVEEAHGGMGFGFETLCLLVEEAGATLAPVPILPALVEAALPIARFGDAEARELLPRLVKGEILLSAAWAEPGNDDALHPACRAVQGEDGWTLQGVKHCVPYAALAERVLVSAATEQGAGLFLVDPKGAGVSLQRQVVTSGEPQFLLQMDGAPVTNVLAHGSEGEEALGWAVQRATAGCCALALGIAEKMTRITAEYTSEREQFGVKIATFQAVGHRAANCFIDVQCLRLAVQQAVSLLDQEESAGTSVQVAKIWAGDVSHRVSYAAQHLHGGMGVDRDYHLFRYCLWAKHVEMMLGSSAATLAQLGEELAGRYIAEAEA